MRKITIALGLLILSTPAFAVECNSMPLSTFRFAQVNNGPGLEKEMSCSKLPQEDCVCIDGIADWSVTSLVDLYEDDLSRPVYSANCPQGQLGCNPVGYDQKYWGKKAVNDPVKLATFQESKALESAARIARKERRRLARERLKAWKQDSIDSLSTNASIKSFLRDTIPEIIELLKEEE